MNWSHVQQDLDRGIAFLMPKLAWVGTIAFLAFMVYLAWPFFVLVLGFFIVLFGLFWITGRILR